MTTMDTKIKEMIDVLLKNRLMNTSEEIFAYEDAVEKLRLSDDVMCLPNILYGFHNDTEHFEVMWGLVHCVEHLSIVIGDIEWLCLIISNLRLLYPHASEWIVILLQRILNTPECIEIFEQTLNHIPFDKKIESLSIIERLRNEFDDDSILLLKKMNIIA